MCTTTNDNTTAYMQGVKAPIPSFHPEPPKFFLERRFRSPNQILQTLPKRLDTHNNTTHRSTPLPPPAPAVLQECVVVGTSTAWRRSSGRRRNTHRLPVLKLPCTTTTRLGSLNASQCHPQLRFTAH